MKLKNAVINNFGMKALSLVLAFLTWFYIGEATRVGPDKTVLEKILSRAPYASRMVTVKPLLVGVVPEGYSLIERDIKVTPGSLLIVGPKSLIKKAEFVETEPIDLSEHTKSKTFTLRLMNVSNSVKIHDAEVQIYLPIEKKEK